MFSSHLTDFSICIGYFTDWVQIGKALLRLIHNLPLCSAIHQRVPHCYTQGSLTGTSKRLKATLFIGYFPLLKGRLLSIYNTQRICFRQFADIQSPLCLPPLIWRIGGRQHNRLCSRSILLFGCIKQEFFLWTLFYRLSDYFF